MTRFLPPEPTGVGTPVCRLTAQPDHLLVTLSGATPERTIRLDGVTAERLGRLGADHRAAVLDRRGTPRAGSPVSATEVLLFTVYELVSAHLVELLGALPRVALVLDGPELGLLPLETAHVPGRPALFELTACFRVGTGPAAAPGPTVSAVPATRRRLRLENHRGDEDGLAAVEMERCLVAAVHGCGDLSPTRPPVERLVHVAGHEPRIPTGLLGPDERSHVVLSGCDSLPLALPPGVASAAGSLWPVDDHANAAFMATYHSRLALRIPPLEALRQAQLFHRALPPEVWAAYVHLGLPV